MSAEKLYDIDGNRLAPAPRKVAILGMGATLIDFINMKMSHPGPGEYVDEIWGSNNVISVVKCDVGYVMDDIPNMLERPFPGLKEKDGKSWRIPPAEMIDLSNVGLATACRAATIPIITSKAYPDRYPTSINYPLEFVLREVLGDRYGWAPNNTTAYMIAHAWALGVKEIHIFGCDFAYDYSDMYCRRKTLEEGKACVEQLLFAGYLMGKFTYHLSGNSSLFDTKKGRPFYGYADGRRAISADMITDLRKEVIHGDTRQFPDDAANGSTAANAAAAPAAPAAAAAAGSTAAGGWRDGRAFERVEGAATGTGG